MPTTISATGPTPFPVDAEQTAILQSYILRNYIAEMVMPSTQKLNSEEFRYTEYSKEEALATPPNELGRKSRPNQLEFGGKEVADFCLYYGYEDVVPISDINAASAVAGLRRENPRNHATRQLKHLMMLQKERRVAGLVFADASYNAKYREVVSADNKFSNEAAKLPSYLLKLLDKPYYRPNILVIGANAWTALRTHPSILKATNVMSGADSGVAARMAIAELLELDAIYVGRARYNSAAEGKAVVEARLWGNHAAFLYRGQTMGGSGMPGGESDEAVPMMIDGKSPTWGFTATYVPMSMYTFYEQEKGILGLETIQCKEAVKEVVCGKDGFGYFLKDVIA